MNAELDAVIDRYFAAIPHAEHVQLLGQMLHHLSDQAVALGTFYGAEPILIGNRLLNAGVAPPPRAAETWNAHQWELRG
jgi:hypothetical protein